MRYILVVEDDSSIRQMLVGAFEAEGYPVREASNGEGALALLRRERPDLIITDLLMPAMDGLEFLRELPLAMDEPPPVLVLSAVYRKAQVRAAIGDAEFLPKPFDMDEFLEKVSRLTGRPEHGPA